MFVQIRECYSDGMNADQVEDLLAGNTPTIITVNDDGDRVTVNMVEALSGLNERMDGQEIMLKACAQLIPAAVTLPDPRQQQRERVTERLTECRYG
ncbi:hypothetical protein ASG93_05075 [Paenibacillus sp. Soil787]|nr:hypothetical protein ASG93_05075 [Paenibacillus sp. Soil787]